MNEIRTVDAFFSLSEKRRKTEEKRNACRLQIFQFHRQAIVMKTLPSTDFILRISSEQQTNSFFRPSENRLIFFLCFSLCQIVATTPTEFNNSLIFIIIGHLNNIFSTEKSLTDKQKKDIFLTFSMSQRSGDQ